MRARNEPPELIWDEDPRWCNAQLGFLTKLLAAGFPISICLSWYAGNVDALKFYFGVLGFLLLLSFLWWIAASLLYALLRAVYFMFDSVRGRR